jgi:hypothetical protein
LDESADNILQPMSTISGERLAKFAQCLPTEDVLVANGALAEVERLNFVTSAVELTFQVASNFMNPPASTTWAGCNFHASRAIKARNGATPVMRGRGFRAGAEYVELDGERRGRHLWSAVDPSPPFVVYG